MKRLLALTFLAITFTAWAEHGPAETPISAEDKARLVKILGEALQDNDITQEQYAQSMAWVNASPCDGVDRELTAGSQALLEVAIAKQQQMKKAQVFESFKHNGWFIVLSDTSSGDNPYFFYSKDPTEGAAPVAVWSGAAMIFETSHVVNWVKQKVPGIPERLANCFAWHVTLSQE